MDKQLETVGYLFCPHCEYLEKVSCEDDNMVVRCSRCESTLALDVFPRRDDEPIVRTTLLEARGTVIRFRKKDEADVRGNIGAMFGFDGKPITLHAEPSKVKPNDANINPSGDCRLS